MPVAAGADAGLRVAAIVGARPNLMKMAPLMEELAARPGVSATLIHTGQHYDERMSGLFFEQLGMPRPHHHLGVGSGSHADQTARVMLALEPLLLRIEPHVVLVVGDVNSTLAAALVAAKLHLPVAHVEAGLRSFDRTMPEELNRILTDQLSDFLFATERSALDNLRREGVDEGRVFFVGNVMIDTLLRHRERALESGILGRLGLEPREYAVVTLHRPANVDDAEALGRAVAILEGAAQRLTVVLPLHPRTRARLEATGLARRLHGSDRIRLLEPLGYLDFLALMAESRVVLTDSGGIQEETTVLGVPCLTLRENTERPVTLEQGTNRLVGTQPKRVLAALDAVLSGQPGASRRGVEAAGLPARPDLWDGGAAVRVVDVLMERLGARAP